MEEICLASSSIFSLSATGWSDFELWLDWFWTWECSEVDGEGWFCSAGFSLLATTVGVARFLKNVGVIVEYRAS